MKIFLLGLMIRVIQYAVWWLQAEYQRLSGVALH